MSDIDGVSIIVNFGAWGPPHIHVGPASFRVAFGFGAVTFIVRDFEEVLGKWWAWKVFAQVLADLSEDQEHVKIDDVFAEALERRGRHTSQLDAIFGDIADEGGQS